MGLNAQDKVSSALPVFSEEKIEDFVNQVYGKEFFVGKEWSKKTIVDALKNRVSFASKPGVSMNAEIPLLSSVPVMKTVNAEQALLALRKFDIAQFNPLLFDINLFPIGKSVVYRIDGTDTMLIIQPQTSEQ